ncbi:GNAT family N-acetyltransferase [Tengunoibacter tsumagoiensis]|uniref:N-acetyltransferase domain-containing protein n=1 Tax=Tengunoibacter tsumagoiensis TaxID=2014871 RepID=A0A401ZUR2_9CHLR|nr:GNAT family N-acetyltransferase [Tengunoibacter tsumagoiensis]GCE10688.1 hypothetical protein KTT_05470 [Tengunoibacter tsumagoiensis]
MGSPFVVRAYKALTDFKPLVRLLHEVEEYDHDGEDISEAAVQAQLNWPGYQPEQTCFVIEHPQEQQLLGFASVFPQSTDRCAIYVTIHPRWRRQQLGQMLMDRVLLCAREMEAKHVTVNANAHNEGANAFLNQHGFWRVGDAWLLHAPIEIELPEVIWPEGYTVQNYASLRHFPTLVDVSLRSYADKWGHIENDPEDAEESVARWLPLFDPTGLFLSFAPDGSVVGLCRAAFNTAENCPPHRLIDILDAPGVVPEHRDKHVHLPLLLTAMHWLRSQGQHAVALQSWGDDEQTIANYRDIGFELLHHFLAYRKNLR